MWLALGKSACFFLFCFCRTEIKNENFLLIKNFWTYSLGAEVAGFAGKTLKEWNITLSRITGMTNLFFIYFLFFCLFSYQTCYSWRHILLGTMGSIFQHFDINNNKSVMTWQFYFFFAFKRFRSRFSPLHVHQSSDTAQCRCCWFCRYNSYWRRRLRLSLATGPCRFLSKSRYSVAARLCQAGTIKKSMV